MPPQQYPQSIGTCVILRNASHQTTEEDKKYWWWAVIHETGYLSQSPGYLPHPFNTANHQINVHRHSLPPCKTNYLSILYCQVLHALFMQATIREIVNKKAVGVTLHGGELPGSERRSLVKAAKLEAEFVTACGANWKFFMTPRFENLPFLWVSQVEAAREVPKHFVLWHQFPRSATVAGLYITSARTIKLQWIFMTGLKDIFLGPPRCHKVAVIRIQESLLFSVDSRLFTWEL